RIDILAVYLARHPDDFAARDQLRSAYIDYGDALQAGGRYLAARDVYRAALRFFPDSPVFRSGLAAASRAAGEEGELVWASGQALRLVHEPVGDGWLIGESPWFLPMVFNGNDAIDNFILDLTTQLPAGAALEIAFRQSTPNAYVWQLRATASRLLLWTAEARRRGLPEPLA